MCAFVSWIIMAYNFHEPTKPGRNYKAICIQVGSSIIVRDNDALLTLTLWQYEYRVTLGS
jgi:hypothetical protein